MKLHTTFSRMLSLGMMATLAAQAVACGSNSSTPTPVSHTHQSLDTNDMSTLVSVSFVDSSGNAQVAETTASDMQSDSSGFQAADNGDGTITLTSDTGSATVSNLTNDTVNDVITLSVQGASGGPTQVTINGFNANYAASGGGGGGGGAVAQRHVVREAIPILWPIAVIVGGGAVAIVGLTCAKQDSNAFDEARAYNNGPNRAPCTYAMCTGPICWREAVIKAIPGCVVPPPACTKGQDAGTTTTTGRTAQPQAAAVTCE